MAELPGQEFVEALRAAVAAYLNSVDRWEAAYRRYHRMPGHARNISSDMVAEQSDFEAQRRALELLLPRAHQLCLKHGLRNPLPNLVRTALGQQTTRQRSTSAISRNERSAVTHCLLQLADACSGMAPAVDSGPHDHELTPSPSSPEPHLSRRREIVAVMLTGAAIAIGLAVRNANRYRPVRAVRSDPTSAPMPAPAVAPPIRIPAIPDAKQKTGAFYLIEGRDMTQWGDYGNILQHGMTAHLARDGGLLSLERTGPYMPPITFPGIGDVVLTSAGRKLLEASGLTGFTFQPVRKARIVPLRWHEWDLHRDEPPEYPESGEPEDYILQRSHDARLAAAMGDIWELVIPVTAKIGRTNRIVDSFQDLYLDSGSWNGTDIFRGDNFADVLGTERARSWFEKNLGAYTRFERFASR